MVGLSVEQKWTRMGRTTTPWKSHLHRMKWPQWLRTQVCGLSNKLNSRRAATWAKCGNWRNWVCSTAKDTPPPNNCLLSAVNGCWYWHWCALECDEGNHGSKSHFVLAWWLWLTSSKMWWREKIRCSVFYITWFSCTTEICIMIKIQRPVSPNGDTNVMLLLRNFGFAVFWRNRKH